MKIHDELGLSIIKCDFGVCFNAKQKKKVYYTAKGNDTGGWGGISVASLLGVNET